MSNFTTLEDNTSLDDVKVVTGAGKGVATSNAAIEKKLDSVVGLLKEVVLHLSVMTDEEFKKFDIE